MKNLLKEILLTLLSILIEVGFLVTFFWLMPGEVTVEKIIMSMFFILVLDKHLRIIRGNN